MKHSFLILFLILFSCEKEGRKKTEVQIAFLADVHLHDVYAAFEDVNYRGILNKETGKYTTLRTMGAQLHSTRLFNENYFAFLSALDDLVSKNIKLVVLPGDFSDDGQPINIRALRRILSEYTEKHKMQFFLTTGNHDPVGPFSEDGGKSDFMGEGGQALAIVSDSSITKNHAKDIPVVVTKGIQKWGYKEIAHELSDFGFFPKKEFLYWETPNSTYQYKMYDLEKALEAATLGNRTYTMPNSSIAIPDMSYLVEPTEDIWLLAIDANVYLPKKDKKNKNLENTGFSNASIGYNNVLTHKKHLIAWVKKVAAKAKQKGKTLIAFSHYPMVEFNDGASEEMKALFGENKMQSHRIPENIVSETFANAGIQIHFGGHMHMNDTGVFTSAKGNTLFNIQTPSLASYPSAYKILTIKSDAVYEVETIPLDTVNDFKALFPLYTIEHTYLDSINKKDIWNKDILKVSTYWEFTQWHLKELIKIRFLEEDWPIAFKNKLLTLNGHDLLLLDASENTIKNSELEAFEEWTGLDMILDFYKLKNADELAKNEIDIERLIQYELVCKNLMRSNNASMALWGGLFYKTLNGQPSNHFEIHLKNDTIERM